MIKFLFCLSAIMVANVLFGQNCDFLRNEVDDMTGNKVIELEPEKIYKKMKTRGPEKIDVNLMKVNNSVVLYIDQYLQGDAYSISEDDDVIMKFNDDSTLKLDNYNSEVADYKKLGLSGASTQWVVTYKIKLDESEINELTNKHIVKLRTYSSEGFIDFEVKDKFSKVLMNQISCINKD